MAKLHSREIFSDCRNAQVRQFAPARLGGACASRDWDDSCRTIPHDCHKVARPGTRIAVIEIGLDDGALGPPMDVNMMVLGPGCERTFAEYRALLEASGFTNAGAIATPMVVIEAFAS